MAYRFEFGISFAGDEGREIARALAARLQELGHAVFFDEDLQYQLLGADGAARFRSVFRDECRFCVVLLSPAYDASAWAAIEREAMQARQQSDPSEFLVPVRLHGHHPDWLPASRIGFDYPKGSVEELAALLARRASVKVVRVDRGEPAFWELQVDPERWASSPEAAARRESRFERVNERLLGGAGSRFDFVSTQYLDSQSLFLDRREFAFPSKDDLEAHLVTLLALFPTIVINRAFLLDSAELDALFRSIDPPEKLAEMFDRGWFTVLSSTGRELTWDALEEDVKRLVSERPKEYQRVVRERFERLRWLGATIHYVDRGLAGLGESYRSRIATIAESLAPPKEYWGLVQEMPFLTPEEEDAMPETLEAVRDKLLHAVDELASPEKRSKARAYLYSSHGLYVNDRSRPVVLSPEQRLIKAAVDVAYHGNAPEQLGISAAYASYNEPYCIASKPVAASTPAARRRPFHLPPLSLGLPSRLVDLLHFRREASFGEFAREDPSAQKGAHDALRAWWEVAGRRLASWGFEPERDAWLRGSVYDGETVQISGIHVRPDPAARPRSMAEFSLMFLRPRARELTPDDLHVAVTSALSTATADEPAAPGGRGE